MITQATLYGQHVDLVRNNIFTLTDIGAPIDGVTGAGIAGPGSEYIDYSTGNRYVQVSIITSPVWALAGGFGGAQQLSGTISSANIVGTGVGQLGHANGVILVPAGGAHVVNELISVVTHYDFAVAAYTGGGNVTVNNGAGGSALTGLVSAANSFGAAADNSDLFVLLATASIPLVENGPINLVAAAAFTQPGTAAGVIRWVANFRRYNTGF